MSIHSLGYLRLRTPNLDEWDRFAGEVLGFMPVAGPTEGSRCFRWDDRPYRLHLVPGDEPAVEAIGWEVGDDRDLAALATALHDAGLEVAHGSDEEAAARLVSGFASFADPAGAPIEVFHGPVLDHRPLVTPLVEGFVTGDMGFGHVVTSVPDLDEAVAFYRDHLGFHMRNTWHLGAMAMAFPQPQPAAPQPRLRRRLPG